jgi:hypothetical protein
LQKINNRILSRRGRVDSDCASRSGGLKPPF